MKKLMFTIACVAFAVALEAKEYTVSSASQITAALNSIQPGDTITMNGGIWNSQSIVFAANGTAAKPILLRASSYGSVILSGTSSLKIGGTYLIVDWLKFENGYSPSGSAVIEFRDNNGNGSRYCRLTRTSITSYNPVDKTKDYKWVSLYGQYNRVDHCSFENKTNIGTTLVVWLENKPNYHTIDHNYFGPRPVYGDNGAETIRVGTSDWSMYDSYTTVEYNYFDRCDGEIEIISNKSCENIYRYNVFVSCQGMLTLRHGNRCSVYGNYFFANNAENSGGIRIIGEDHKVYNNYIEKTAGSSMKTGITMTNGVPNSPLNRYFQVKRALVVFNTLIENRYSFNIGAGKDSELSLPPLDCVIANNLVWSTHSPLMTYTDTPVSMAYEGNIFYGAALGITKPAGITAVDPKMIYAADSLWRIGANSPAVNASAGNYDFVSVDIDGQPRSGIFDTGADEFSSDPVTQKPIRRSDVGPTAIVTSVTRKSKDALPERFQLVQSYPNPFNPATSILFSVPERSESRLVIVNSLGEEIVVLFSGVMESEKIYTARFDGSRFASGLYFAELQFNEHTFTHKMLLLK
ncbi:MAG: chondroitinase-B domain-containing protein [Bacteroidota bacterium]